MEHFKAASLYFHFPFCKKKCPYCHFYVIPDRDHGPFLEALEREWDMLQSLLAGKEIVSVYFGGGTPSLCLEGIEWVLSRVQGQEITVETNPEDVTEEKIARLKELGVNRMSIGVQSLSNVLLKTLGREHTADGAIDAVLKAKNGGIDNITIDLMYELPYQTFELWKETVDRACALPIAHLSLYNLTFEPHTVFKKKEGALRPHLPSEEEAAKMLAYACETFEKSGLERYEISAFARENKRSIHNTGYWQGRPFLGLGPSAFSFWE
ncbi:MAG: radical SAM family heme chaperone HemW, partial [Chlamydiia bacterium]|nr:radical SAM family heme chaperone HemW [Chlamydiia bacterium]